MGQGVRNEPTTGRRRVAAGLAVVTLAVVSLAGRVPLT